MRRSDSLDSLTPQKVSYLSWSEIFMFMHIPLRELSYDLLNHHVVIVWIHRKIRRLFGRVEVFIARAELVCESVGGLLQGHGVFKQVGLPQPRHV